MKIQKALILILLVGVCSPFNLFNLRTISNKTSARCMDGSNYGFYIYDPEQQGIQVTKRNILIYFDQTPLGWCAKEDLSSSLTECHKWLDQNDSLYDFASSNNWATNDMFLSGILSLGDGGVFSENWHKVRIPSCDGGSYLGNKDPISFKGKKLYFRGSENVKQSFKYLKQKGYLDNMEQVILAGSFNGAIGAFMWQDQLQALTSTPIRMLADAPIYLNQMNYEKNDTIIEKRMQMVNKLMLENLQLPKKACQAKFGDSEKWNCLFIENLYPYFTQEIPVFYIQSYYDGWEIREVLGFICAQDQGTLQRCTPQHKAVIDEYSKNVTILLNTLVNGGGKNQLTRNQNQALNGGFGIACVGHKFTFIRYSDQSYQVPMNSGNTPLKVVAEWISKPTSRVVRFDDVQWPNNKPCATTAGNQPQLKDM